MKLIINNEELNIKPVFCSSKVSGKRSKNNDEYSLSFKFIALDKQGKHINLTDYDREAIGKIVLKKINEDSF
ncbi:TPA: hypothetical protein RXK40_000893 [Campylobacter jejuni]|nr:hypothetical protein [Campylobacter jejuni]